MPRTRAALRNAIFEDLEDAAAVPLPSTPQKGGDRAPLGEILLNEEAPPRIQPDVDMKKPGKAVSAKKDKRVGRKKKPVNKENDRPGRDPMVLEDDYESSSSTSAIEEACQELRNGGKDGTDELFFASIRARANHINNRELSRTIFGPKTPDTAFKGGSRCQKEVVAEI